jgi:hypothetical protein
MSTTLQQRGRKSAEPSSPSPMISEISDLCDDVQLNMRRSVAGALKVGIRLLWLHRESGVIGAPGGFRTALEAIEDRVPRSTAYRWINAATAVLAGHQGATEPDDIKLPEPCTPAWDKLEKVLVDKTQGMSLRRLLIGSSDVSEESRFDTLISADEAGNKTAAAILDQVAAGKFTLVQAIRALGGATTKEKHRTDPVYLDLDGATGQPTGLFPKCLVTLANTFSRWDQLSEPARREVKASWKEVVSKLPKELR